MEGYESLEEGEIPSPPPAVVLIESDNDKKYKKKVEHSVKAYRPVSNSRKRKCRAVRKKRGVISDFDVMRTKCLERLKQKEILEQEIASKEMQATEIDDVEMEDADVITLGDSEEDELKKLRDLALSSQRTTNKTSDKEVSEKTENEFLLRAEALKTAILKKRPSILKKKRQLNNRKHLLQNDNVDNVKANLSKIDETCNDRVDIDIKLGKENLDSTENNDEEALREQLIASIKSSNKSKSLLVDSKTIEQSSCSNKVTENCKADDILSDNQSKCPLVTISPIKEHTISIAGSSKKITELSTKNENSTEVTLLKTNPSEGVENSFVSSASIANKSHDLLGTKVSTMETKKSSFQVLSENYATDINNILTPSINEKPVVAKAKILKPKIISKNERHVLKPNGLVVKKKTKDVKKLPISVIVPKLVEKRIVVNLRPDSSDDDVEEPKILAVPGVLMNSIDDFLLNARRLTETSTVPSTPEAVYAHLPPSQRIEYIKLKKKLAEKEENLKLKKIENKTCEQPSTKTTSNVTKVPLEDVKANNNSTTSKEQKESKTINNIITQENTSKTVANIFTSVTKNTNMETTTSIPQPMIKADLPISNNKTDEQSQKLPIRSKLVLSTSTNSSNSIKLGKAKMKKETVSHVMKNNNTEKNNLSVFIKKNVTKQLLPTNKPKNVQQSYVRVDSNITNATHLMNLLKKELILEKNACNELSRLKLQVTCAEQKKKVHSTRVSLLRSRVKSLLETSKLSSPGKSTSPEKSDENKRKERSDLKINDIIVSSKMESIQSVKDENSIREEMPLLKKRKIEGNFGDYESPLSKIESDINPHVEFCPHDLTGKCRDPDCQYQHLSISIVK